MPASAASIKVVASLPPVHSLVAGIMAGEGVPRLLVQGGTSPHTFVMKPSSARMLNEAQVVFWVGPQLEGYLVRPLLSLSEETRVVELAKAKDSADKFVPVSEHHHADDHEHDPHIWLDPRKAADLADVIADALSLADSANATLYKKNRDLIIAQLTLLEAELLKILSPVSGVPYLVFHDAYGHFQDRFGLVGQGVVARNIDRLPGAQRISFLRQKIMDSKIVCIFMEPQFPPTIVKTLIEGTSVRMGILDPLGVGLESGPSLYSALMQRLANSFSSCLSANS